MIVPSEPVSDADIAGHYDSLDRFYRETWGDDLHHGFWKEGDESPGEAIEKLRELLARLALIQAGDSVCDVGCGYGSMAIYLAKNRGAAVTGITLSEEQWRIANQAAGVIQGKAPRPEFHHGSWLRNDFPSRSFEAVISIECFSHVEDKARFFREAARTLKPEGRLAMTAWMARSNPPPWAVRWLLEPICREGRFAGLANIEELAGFAKASGFEIKSLQEIGPKVKKTWWVITGRLVRNVLTKTEYRRFLWKNLRSDRVFVFTVLRVGVAFELGMLNYAVLEAQKP